MTSIQLIVTGARIHAKVCGPLTSGMVGIPVSIQYDNIWDGLTRTLVCKGGGTPRSVSGIGTEATVAHEVMRAGVNLYLGIEGRNADGTLVIPTTWADCGPILEGANATDDTSLTEDNPIWTQLQQQIGALYDLETPETDSLVAAINSVNAGLFTCDGGVFTDSNGYYLNPPMVFGTEYATLERFNGEVVYKKAIDFGQLSAAGILRRKLHGCSYCYIIGCRGVAYQEGGNCQEYTYGSTGGCVEVAGDYVYFNCISDLSSYTGFVELKYTKN